MSRDIHMTLIDSDPGQPRQHFDGGKITELAQSMDAKGLVVPILLRPTGGERFTIVHGERRYRAAKQLGWETIRAEVRELDANEAHWLALIENVQRQNLSPIEEARAFEARLSDGITQAELGERIGKSQSYIAQKLRLLRLPEPLRFFIDRGAITEGHARQLMRIEKIYCGIESDWGWDYESWDELGDIGRQDAIAFLVGIRPEDNPPGNIFLADNAAGELITKACGLQLQCIKDCGGAIPQWEVATFWWASLTIYAGISVSRLSKTIDRWIERLLSGLVWVWMKSWRMPECPDITDVSPWEELQGMLWYGHKSDIRHAGAEQLLKMLLREVESGGILDILVEKKMLYAGAKLAVPSSCQSWGCDRERYDALNAKVYPADEYVT